MEGPWRHFPGATSYRLRIQRGGAPDPTEHHLHGVRLHTTREGEGKEVATILDIHERTRRGMDTTRKVSVSTTRRAVLALGAGVVTGLAMGLATTIAGRWS